MAQIRQIKQRQKQLICSRLCLVCPGVQITNRQKFVALSSLVEGLHLKVTGNKCPQTFDDSLFAPGARHS